MMTTYGSSGTVFGDGVPFIFDDRNRSFDPPFPYEA